MMAATAGGAGGAQGRARRGQRRRRHGQGRDDRRPAPGVDRRSTPTRSIPRTSRCCRTWSSPRSTRRMRSAQELQESKLGGLGEGFDPMSALDALGMGGMGGLGGGGGGAGGLPGGQPNRAARRRSVSGSTACSPRPSSAWSPSSPSSPASASGPRSGSRSTSCAPRPRTPTALAEAIRDVKEKITLCEVCFNLAEGPRCTVCLDERRDADRDLRGRGARRRDPDRAHARVPRPLPRARRRAVADRRRRARGPQARPALRARRDETASARSILATNPTTTGEATALHVAAALHERAPDVAVTRLASGLPVGGDLEYADEVTLGRAFAGRRAV